MWHVISWLAGIALLFFVIRAIRAARREKEWVRRSIAPGAGIAKGRPPRRSIWDFIRFG